MGGRKKCGEKLTVCFILGGNDFLSTLGGLALIKSMVVGQEQVPE